MLANRPHAVASEAVPLCANLQRNRRGAQIVLTFRVQFLDRAAKVIVEWEARAADLAGALEILDGLEWPLGALRVQILDDDGRLVHWQSGPE
jgi:hypothetical protein